MQMKKSTEQIQNSENFDMSKTWSDRINTKRYQRQLIKTLNGPSICEKPIRIPKFPVPDKAENKRVEKCIQKQMPYTHMPESNPPTQLFMNQQYKTAQIGGNIVRNCVFDSAQTNPVSSHGAFPVMYNPQPWIPVEYASSVATSAFSTMSAPLGPTPIGNSTSCTSLQGWNSNVLANTMYYTGLSKPYAQLQPLTNTWNTATKKSVENKVAPENQMQYFGCKKYFSGFENGLVGGGSRAEFGGHQVNLNQQVGVSHGYWPQSQYMTHVVSPSGYPMQPQQQCYSTDSCFSVNSFSTTNEDAPVYYNTMNQIVPEASMQYTNVHGQNPIIQTNSIHCLTDSCSSVDSFRITKEDLSWQCNTMKQIVPRGGVQYTNAQVQNPIIQTNSINGSKDTYSCVDSCSTANEDFSVYYNTMKQIVPGRVIQYTNVHPQNPIIQTNSIHGSTDPRSNVDSFSTTNKDLSVYYNTMKQIAPEGGMQYTNVQSHNPIIWTNSIHGLESNRLGPHSEVQYSMSNSSVFGVNVRSDTTSIHSDLGVQPSQCNFAYQLTTAPASAQKIWANHIKTGNDCNGSAGLDLTNQQQGVSPQLCMTHVVNSEAINQQKYWGSSTASELSSVKNVNQSVKSVIPTKKQFKLNLSVKVNLIPDDCGTGGFNRSRGVNKNPFNGFKHKSKANWNVFNGFKHHSKVNKNPFTGFTTKENAAIKPVARSNVNYKVTKSPFTG